MTVTPAADTAGATATGTPARESRLLRRTRLRLLLWSAGSTLIVLLTLSVALYAAVARQLATDSEQQLRRRAEAIRALGIPEAPTVEPADGVQVPLGFAAAGSDPGIVFGGPESGTIALIIGPRDVVATGPPVLAPGSPAPAGAPFARAVVLSPDPEGIATAREGREKLAETTVLGTPVRVLSAPVTAQGETYVVQVLSDRSSEQRALGTLVAVLAGGGVLVLTAALAVGWMYAGRALVPIRDSLRRQREFAADASHELRTPLAVVRSNLDLLRPRIRDDGAASTALADAQAETDRMGRLVDDLLLLARTDADAPEVERLRLDLADEAANALGQLAGVAAARGVELALDVEPAATTGDPARLRQLVTILVDNAIRHARGHVRVSVARDARGGVRLTVEDDGPGVRPEHRHTVFERFWRAPDAPPGGSGLGLAIARWIAERHDGSVTVDERPGGGARFSVQLPAG